MLITESEIRKIINEEIEKLIEEEQLDEIFGSAIKKGLGGLAAGLAGKLGVTSAALADREAAASAEKAAGEESALSAKKEAAKSQVVQKVRSISNKVLKLHDEVRSMEELSAPLSYAGGGKLDVKAVGDAVESLMMVLDKVEQDITGERGHVKGSSLRIAPSLKEKKIAAK